MIYTTLNKIRAHHPCGDGWKKLLKHLGKTDADDEPLAISTILESNGLDDALWCLRALPEYDRLWHKYAIWCASQVQHLMDDARSLHALDVAERYTNGLATYEELANAKEAARKAACSTPCGAARSANWAAWSATWGDAMIATNTTRDAWDDARDAQEEEFMRIITEYDNLESINDSSRN